MGSLKEATAPLETPKGKWSPTSPFSGTIYVDFREVTHKQIPKKKNRVLEKLKWVLSGPLRQALQDAPDMEAQAEVFKVSKRGSFSTGKRGCWS